MIEKVFVKVCSMLILFILGILVVPICVNESSTAAVFVGVALALVIIYTEIKILMSFFKEKK